MNRGFASVATLLVVLLAFVVPGRGDDQEMVLEFQPMLNEEAMKAFQGEVIDFSRDPFPSSFVETEGMQTSDPMQVMKMLAASGGAAGNEAKALMRGEPSFDEPVLGGSTEELPVEVFSNLFPGPLMIEDATVSSFGGPDPLIMDMLQETHDGFQDGMLPVVHAAAQAALKSPMVCHKDLEKHCAKSRSQLHCLGSHQGDISKECQDQVGKSVPFVCSAAIDQYCDVLQRGILNCLEEHMPLLDSNCKDAVVLTRAVLVNTNTHKVALANKKSGKKLAWSVPSIKAMVASMRKSFEVQRRHLYQRFDHAFHTRHAVMLLTAVVILFVLLKGPTIYLPHWATPSGTLLPGLSQKVSSWRYAVSLERFAWLTSRSREGEKLLLPAASAGIQLQLPGSTEGSTTSASSS